MTNNFIVFKTFSPSGDLISFLSGMRRLYLDTGRKAMVYHRLNVIGGSYIGADSAYDDGDNNPICFGRYAFDMMHPLLLSQEYIYDYRIYDGEMFEIDLDKLRMQTFTNQPKGSLNRYPNYVFPQMATDLSEPWIEVEGDNWFNDKVLINFTVRHRNSFINYFFLKQYEDRIIFTGLPKERDLFCKEFGLKIPLLEVSDFLQLAKAIKGCKFLLSNQSMVFQIAEAMKVPRILEIFPMIPNVIPVGKDAFDFYHQQAAEVFFKKLIDK
jgi:hypothetical protein